MTPREAIAAGSTYIVVGRPITLRRKVREVIRWKQGYALNGPSEETISVSVGGKPRQERADSATTSVTQCGRWEITMPTDTNAMLSSAELDANGADVYRCVVDGRTEYTDRPCDDGAAVPRDDRVHGG